MSSAEPVPPTHVASHSLNSWQKSATPSWWPSEVKYEAKAISVPLSGRSTCAAGGDQGAMPQRLLLSGEPHRRIRHMQTRT